MKKLIITIIFLIPLICYSQDNKIIIQKDKIYHLSAGITISEISYIPYYINKWDFRTSTKVAFWGSLTLACYKEMADSYGQTGWNWNDIKYTMSGTLFTIGVNYGIYKLKKRRKRRINIKKELVEF